MTNGMKRTMTAVALCAAMMASVFADAKSDALLRATERNNAAEAIRLIKAGANVNAKSSDDMSMGVTPLMYAAAYNATDVMKLLIKAGANVNARSLNLFREEADTALIYAAKENAVDAARLLLASGADVNISPPHGYTALWIAVDDNRPELVDIFIAAGADVNVNNIGLTTVGSLLMYAAEKNLTDIMKKLIAAGADVNLRQVFDETALMWAAKANAVDAIQVLLDAGADINAVSRYANNYHQSSGTALMYAVHHKKLDAVKALIKAGADVNIRGDERDYGCTALMWAAQNSGKVAADIVQALIDAGADANARDKYGNTVISYAKDDATVKKLLKQASAAQAKNTSKEKELRQAEDEHLRNVANAETMKWITSCDKNRDEVYDSYKKSVEAWLNFPSEVMSKSAKVLDQHFRDNNIDPKLPFDKKTDLYESFIKDLEGKYAAQVKQLNLGMAVTGLKNLNEEVRKLTKQLKPAR
ncbi:MAG: ankyrin repeat domain-containing protein [Treponemataceae bacterium]|nr:ankyrin repeat domain-containing protein [Treponemataceae bacterium]